MGGGEGVDGACTFRSAIETMIEIDYQLSQAGRGLKYSSDPTLLIKEPVGQEGDIVRGGGNALIVSEKGDAKLLEIGGTAASAVIEYVRVLREFALESVHGNRASPEKLSGAQSGRALEMMNQGLIWLADNLRVSYGDALLRLAGMVVRASAVFPLRVMGAAVAPNPDDELLILNSTEYLDIDHAAPITEFRSRRLDAGVVTFPSIHPRYSYVRLDAEGFVVQAAEKNPISRDAIAGFTWYATGGDFIQAAQDMICKDANVDHRYFISLTLNEMVLPQKRMGAFAMEARRYHPLKSQRQIAVFEADSMDMT